MSRKRAREGAMSLVYKMDINKEFTEEMTELFLTNFEYTENEKKYIKAASSDIIANLEKIDEYIQNNLKGWRIERLAKVDLAVLRISVYEMIYRDDIPIEVSINEAIEIVKKYSDVKSYKFINGVLGGVVKDLESEEK